MISPVTGTTFLTLLSLSALAAPAKPEQGTVCTGLMDATVEQLQPVMEEMCHNVQSNTHTKLPNAKPDLNAWSTSTTIGTSKATLIAVDGDSTYSACIDSFKAVQKDCSRNGKAAYGLSRIGNQLYIIDEEVTQIPELVGS